MRATRQLRYAIYGVFDLAYHAGDRPISVQEISQRQAIPTRYLEQIFQKLRRAGLVSSKRGPGGGYVLSRPPEKISLADVTVAVQGGLLMRADAGEVGAPECPSFVWGILSDALGSILMQQTIADLCVEASRRGLKRAAIGPATYDI